MSALMMQPNLDQLAGLTGVRAGALSRWQETGWPNSRVEQWRFTRLASLEKMDLRPASVAATAKPAAITAILPENSVILSFSNGVLDVAGLAALPDGVNLLRDPARSMLVITHYQRLLNHIVPDYVHILAGGKIRRTGGKELALEVEESGYVGIDDAA